MMQPIQISSLPKDPGVYLFKDSKGDIIYVGKAKNLRKRVSSYFKARQYGSTKARFLSGSIASLDWIAVDNEIEALLLENKLIKKHSPKYNISLKDSKTFAYIKLTDEKFPRILSTRKVTKDGSYFGPYTDGLARQRIIQLAVRLFKLRTCKRLPKRACLNYHIGLCTAPCILNVTGEEYRSQVEKAREFLLGDTKWILKQLNEEMIEASSALQYEKALECKRQIDAILHLGQKQKVDLIKRFDQDVVALSIDHASNKAIIEMFTISKGVISGKKEYAFDRISPYGDDHILESFLKVYYHESNLPSEIIVNRKFWQGETSKKTLEEYFSRLAGMKVSIVLPARGERFALIKLAEKNASLNFTQAEVLGVIKDTLNLSVTPSIIECFDISNLGRDFNVAAMVRYVDAKPDKKNYRRFEIRSFKGKNDDFAAMQEVVLRRYKRLKDENAELPQLIIIDGGKGQLSSALGSLEQLELKIPMIALAKEREEIYLPAEDEPRRFERNSKMMLLIRRIRDDVHRLAVSYNRKKRDMRMREDAGREY